jgi:hypothetical protein
MAIKIIFIINFFIDIICTLLITTSLISRGNYCEIVMHTPYALEQRFSTCGPRRLDRWSAARLKSLIVTKLKLSKQNKLELNK